MSDKMQEIRKAISELQWIAPQDAHFILSELDVANERNTQYQLRNADLAGINIDLRQQLDSAKQENEQAWNEFKDSNDTHYEIIQSLQQRLKQALEALEDIQDEAVKVEQPTSEKLMNINRMVRNLISLIHEADNPSSAADPAGLGDSVESE